MKLMKPIGAETVDCLRSFSIYIYTCKLYKLISLCWSTGCFVKCNSIYVGLQAVS